LDHAADERLRQVLAQTPRGEVDGNHLTHTDRLAAAMSNDLPLDLQAIIRDCAAGIAAFALH
jgi:hypothetical protein